MLEAACSRIVCSAQKIEYRGYLEFDNPLVRLYNILHSRSGVMTEPLLHSLNL
jgi:hypothetical protein